MEFIWFKNGFKVAMVMVVVMCVLTWFNMVLRWSRFKLVLVNRFKWFQSGQGYACDNVASNVVL